MKRRWGGGRQAKEGKSTDSRCQTKAWVTQQHRENPFLRCSVLGQKYTVSKHSRHHSMYRIYMCIYVHRIFIKVFGFWSASILWLMGEIGTFCEMSIKYKGLLLLMDTGYLLLGNCNICHLASLWSLDCRQSWTKVVYRHHSHPTELGCNKDGDMSMGTKTSMQKHKDNKREPRPTNHSYFWVWYTALSTANYSLYYFCHTAPWSISLVILIKHWTQQY